MYLTLNRVEKKFEILPSQLAALENMEDFDPVSFLRLDGKTQLKSKVRNIL
jgi:hypothetical protein